MTTRAIRPSAFFHRLVRAGLLAAAWALCLLPFQIRAQAVGKGGCSLGTTYVPGSGVAMLQKVFVPAVLRLNRNVKVGDVVYSTPLPDIPWTCGAPDRLAYYGPEMVRDASFVTTTNAELKRTGLAVRLVLNAGTYEPGGLTAEKIALGPVWASQANPTMAKTLSGMVSGRLELFVQSPIDKPMQVTVPTGSSLFRIEPGGGWLVADYISIGSSQPNTTVYLIPDTCLVKVAVPNTVDLGVAYSVGSLPLPAPKWFDVNVALNPDCDGFGDPSAWGGFILPLNITFSTPDVAAGAMTIPLKNSEGTPNGLKLEIKKLGAIPIAFNREMPTDPPSLIAAVSPAMNLHYTAELVKTGAPLVTGKFSQEVVVNVNYL